MIYPPTVAATTQRGIRSQRMAHTTVALQVIKPEQRADEQASGSMLRKAAIAQGTVGAQKIWLGYVELPPACTSAVHHHGEAESGIYIISGTARFYTGDALDQRHEAQAGDFVWVPPNVVHVEMNTSHSEPVQMVVARSTQQALTFNLPTPEGWRPG